MSNYPLTKSKQKRNETAARRAANNAGHKRKPAKAVDLRGALLHDGSKERGAMPYQAYLKTRHWQIVRRAALKQAANHCMNCGSSARLRVHHLTYATLWQEHANDVTVLCDDCHNLLHGLYL